MALRAPKRPSLGNYRADSLLHSLGARLSRCRLAYFKTSYPGLLEFYNVVLSQVDGLHVQGRRALHLSLMPINNLADINAVASLPTLLNLPSENHEIQNSRAFGIVSPLR